VNTRFDRLIRRDEMCFWLFEAGAQVLRKIAEKRAAFTVSVLCRRLDEGPSRTG
jgi:hypothetical protein